MGDRQMFREAVIREYAPNRVLIEADLQHPGYLVLTDVFAPGWTAKVDGNREMIVPGNVAFRAIPLPPGSHRVELNYSPPGFKIGLGISLLCVCVALGLIARGIWKTEDLQASSSIKASEIAIPGA
jgi:uncharacterized membrane protein YfhO